MVRKGREAELILEELEKLSLDGIAEIKSPDWILDVITGEMREVDVSIRCSIGTHNFLTVIEVRDRKKAQDVTWIEQIIQKTKDIKANKVIAVSTSGFTRGAKIKAELNNILLRTLEKFDVNETIDWLKWFILNKKKFNVIQLKLELIDVRSGPKENENKLVELGKLDPLEKRVLVEQTGEYVSISDIVHSIVNNEADNFLYGDLEENNLPIRKKLIANCDEDNKNLIELKGRKYYINSLKIVLDCWIESTELSFKNALKYREDKKPLLDKIDYEMIVEDNIMDISIIKDHENSLAILKWDVSSTKK